jgi:hypothetical protein
MLSRRWPVRPILEEEAVEVVEMSFAGVEKGGPFDNTPWGELDTDIASLVEGTIDKHKKTKATLPVLE